MDEKEKNFIIKINVDKAKNKVIVPILLIVISILTYAVPLMYGEFDFGMIFEIISLICLLVARKYMTKYDEIRSKRYIICSMFSIGWILVYDAIVMIANIQNFTDFAFLGYDFFFGEMILIAYLIALFAVNKDLSKATNPIQYKKSTDWFYEKYDDENKEDGGHGNV